MAQQVDVRKDCDLTGELSERWVNTPDFHILKLHQFVPVFVYGTLKYGENNHKWLKDCPFLGIGETITPCYRMKSYAGMFPILKSETRKEEISKCEYVLGEVYAVPPKRLLHIDKVEDNGYMFQREMKHVWMPNQSFQGTKGMVKPSIKVWIYLGTSFFENLEELPDVATTKYNNRRYYHWEGKKESDSMWEPWEDGEEYQGEFTIEGMNKKFVQDYDLRNGKIPF